MKRLFTLVALCAASIVTTSAQNNIYKAVAGAYIDASGAVAVADPSTTIAVDIVVEREHTIVGPYARYAQKYLNVRGSLVEKTVYSVKDAKLSILDIESALKSGEIAPPTMEVHSYMGNENEFAKVLPDRMSSATVSQEDAAAQAAAAIFSIRKSRMELIKGEAGENVFGGGLKDALAALDAKEQAYLELFLGKKVVTTYTHRVALPMSASAQAYTVAKISSSKGILAAASQEGEAITLNVTPSNKAQLSSIAEVDPRDKTAIQVRIADPATCVVKVGQNAVASAVLPIFELGRTAYISGVIKR
ncbi:MAG: DUF4831 family protein [Alistipes sp.]|nr:DUF4831 family protein [Alistipes sp.]